MSLKLILRFLNWLAARAERLSTREGLKATRLYDKGSEVIHAGSVRADTVQAAARVRAYSIVDVANATAARHSARAVAKQAASKQAARIAEAARKVVEG